MKYAGKSAGTLIIKTMANTANKHPIAKLPEP